MRSHIKGLERKLQMKIRKRSGKKLQMKILKTGHVLPSKERIKLNFILKGYREPINFFDPSINYKSEH